MQPVSIEYAERLEDEIAEMLSGKDDVEVIRRDYLLLLEGKAITSALYRERVKCLDRIGRGLDNGKRNTAALRNGGRA